MSNSSKPTVYLVDDDKSIRDSVRLQLKGASAPLATYADAAEFLEALPENAVGCVLLDANLPDKNGLEVMHELEKRQIALPVIFLIGQADVPLAVKAVRGGVFDVIEKPLKDKALVERVKQALALGQKWDKIQAERKKIAARMANLTRREREVMDLLVSGMKNKTIAEELGISRKTLDIHRSKVMGKMEARTVADLVRWSYMNNPKQLAVTTPARELVIA